MRQPSHQELVREKRCELEGLGCTKGVKGWWLAIVQTPSGWKWLRRSCLNCIGNAQIEGKVVDYWSER